MRIGAKYRHFKGGDYKVVELIPGDELTERKVSYQSLEGGSETWTCTLASFLQTIEWEGRLVPRFRRF